MNPHGDLLPILGDDTGETAIDPVCGMTVDIASARYMSEYEGQLFYFCAAGCKLAFDKAPGSYVEGAHHS